MYLRAKAWGYLPVRTLQSCKALMFLALAGLEAKANRDSCMARPTAQSWWPGQNRQILAHVHRGRSPWTKQPLNSSLETQETSFESSYCSQAKRAVSSSRRRLRSIRIRGRGAAGKLVPPGSLADLAGVSTAHGDGRLTTRYLQRRGKHKPIVLLSMEIVRS